MANRERVALDDASWLHMDSHHNPMVVNTLVLLGDRPDWAAVEQAVRARVVARFPRFGQRIIEAQPRFGAFGGPCWEDDPDFDLARHLRRVELPAGEFEPALQAHLGAEAATLLDQDRPRWVIHLLDGPDDRAAILLRSHHSMADGLALVQVVLALADPPAGGHHPGQMMLGSPGGPGGRPSAFEAVGEKVASLTNLSRLRDASSEARDRWQVYRKLAMLTDQDNPLRVRVSGTKAVGWTPAVATDEVRVVARAAGATVNDVALAVLAGALRRYLLGRGAVPRRVGVTVPFNLRDLDAPLDPGLGNQVGLVFVNLPVDVVDHRERLDQVRRRMASIKDSPEGEVVHGGMAMVGAMPTRGMANAWMEVFTGKCTAIITNIVGPRTSLTVGGAPVDDFLLWVPTSGSIGLGLSVVTYDGRLRLGVQADRAVVPELDELVAAMAAELAELERFAPTSH